MKDKITRLFCWVFGHAESTGFSEGSITNGITGEKKISHRKEFCPRCEEWHITIKRDY